jgi:AcrR family transcriptional regulator
MKTLILKKTILKEAEEKFIRFGFAKVPMDEISNYLGISKKTLYKLFQSKEELILQICLENFNEIKQRFENVFNNHDLNYKEKFKNFLVILYSNKLLNSSCFKKLGTIYPKVKDQSDIFFKKIIIDYFDEILRSGREKGIINTKFSDNAIISVFLLSLNGNSEMPDLYKIHEEEGFINTIDIILEGIIE